MGGFSLSRVCHGNYPFIKVNDANAFEALKSGGTIEWGYIYRILISFTTNIFFDF